jgi:septal ring factor EnvC (AmiA/AmiB activator)
MNPRDEENDDDFRPDESGHAEPLIRELRAEMVRLQAQIDQIAAASQERAREIADLRGRLAELESRIGEIRGRYRRSLKLWLATAAMYGTALGLALSYVLRP